MVLEEPLYVMTYKMYLSNNDTYTIIDILDYSNITLAWGLQQPLNITWINHTSQMSAAVSNNSSKQAHVFMNTSVTQFFNEKSGSIDLVHSQINKTGGGTTK